MVEGEGRGQRAEGRRGRQKAGGRRGRQKAEGRGQKVGGRRERADIGLLQPIGSHSLGYSDKMLQD
jgi:hypothetical protein